MFYGYDVDHMFYGYDVDHMFYGYDVDHMFYGYDVAGISNALLEEGPRDSILLPIESHRRLWDKAEWQNVTTRQYIIGVCYCPYSAVSRTTVLM